MTPSHTPGPWTYRKARECDGLYFVEGPTPRDAFLADVHDGNGHHPADSNARLIAAAPDLLAACEALLSDDLAAYAKAVTLARAALSRARGEGGQS